ncbi:FYVE-domain-containing protein [Aspergillus steynii IBT 23096]|uniref:RING-type E3 ubiquitin transferase n=1 Tax=Aspergillus steynii IBT 23096 TaxID=1392250 RepID=A0A2I2GF84_9EURO|nr:FYVE-domain-containing protein [Aspergillus steynii IBT 23096]PLB51544.1 FYVE-domain-containing protein [Aspergillus steynii IBT 23096]
MSSLSSSVSSASSNPAATHASAFSAPERTATRPHANSYGGIGAGEAGPSAPSDRRAERRRSTLSGSDRKRRLVQDGDAWLRRAASGDDALEAGPSRRPSDLNSRSISSGSSHPRRDPAMPGASYATAIDLSSSSPPQHHPHPPTGERWSSWARTGSNYLEYIRPRWQPDTEVTECPICGIPFSFWYRKHHCRKCGRVVCSSCSPHRITIPRQFIVRPPDSRRPSVAPLVPPRAAQLFDPDTNANANAAINPALGGGEEVRLCNPCVPDPNPDPPRGYTTVRPYPGQPNQSRHRSYHSLSIPSRSSYGSTHDNFSSRPSRRTVGSNDYSSTLASLGGSLGSRFSERPVDYGSMSGRYPPSMGVPAHVVYPPQSSRPPSSFDTRSAAHDRRRVHERDLCPICDHELPPLGANGNEDIREAHIRECIDSHGRQPGSPSQSGSPVSQPVLPVRMIAFTATEKDCLGHDGSTQECTICMEDYEVGQALVRLECLCKFHKRCIVEWFERKKECPVHKVS